MSDDSATTIDSMSDIDLPRRRLRLKLDLEADALGHIFDALEHIALDIERQGLEVRQVISGGWASGYHYEMTCDPEQDGDNYRDQLKGRSVAR